MSNWLQKFKAIKKIRLSKSRTGVIYRGEDGLYYAGVKSKDNNGSASPIESDEPQESEPSTQESKQEQSSGSIWDNIFDKLKDEPGEEKDKTDDDEIFKRSEEVEPPKEWMPSNVLTGGMMDNDISDEDAKDVKWQEVKKQEERRNEERKSKVGTKPGDFITHPPANELEYNRLYNQCSSVIDKMKDKLKFEAKPTNVRRRFIRQGSLMQDAIARAVPMSQAGFEVPNIYKRTMRRLELQDCYMVLLADLSGSMDGETIKKAFTVVSEACGQWIPDERFAIYIFGTNYAKLKAFDEPYSKVRHRIGGVDQWRSYDSGGTVMHQPLKHILDHTKKVLPEGKQKVIITLSDWELSYEGRDSRTIELLNEFIARNWIVINLGLGGCGYHSASQAVTKARNYPGIAKPCDDFKDLPRIFFEIYGKISYGGATHKTIMSPDNANDTGVYA